MTVNLTLGKYSFSILLNFFPIVNTDLHLSHSELKENLAGIRSRGKPQHVLHFDWLVGCSLCPGPVMLTHRITFVFVFFNV